MDELEKLSNEELFAIAGIQPPAVSPTPSSTPAPMPTPSMAPAQPMRPSPPTGDLESMSNEQLMQIAGISPKKKMGLAEFTAGTGLAALDGLTFNYGDEIVAAGSAPIAALRDGKSLSDAYDQQLNLTRNIQKNYSQEHPYLSGVMGIAGAVKNPVQILGKAQKAKGILGGIVKGGTEGAFQGAAYSLGDGEGGISNRVTEATSGGLLGGTAGGLLGGVGGAVSKVAKEAPGAARKLETSALGLRPSDLQKSIKHKGLLDTVEGSEIPIRQAMKNVTKRGTFESAETELERYTANLTETQNLIGKVSNTISKADLERTGSIKLSFPKATQYIKTVPADDRGQLIKELKNFERAIKEVGEDTLQGLQTQKVGLYNKAYTEAGKPREVLDRYIAQDVRDLILKNAPDKYKTDISKLNRTLGEHLEINKVLERAVGRDEGVDAAQFLRQEMRTSGGVGAPLIAGMAGASGPVGMPVAVAGATLSAAASKGATPEGAMKLASTFGKAGKYANKIEPYTPTGKLPGYLSAEILKDSSNDSYSQADQFLQPLTSDYSSPEYGTRTPIERGTGGSELRLQPELDSDLQQNKQLTPVQFAPAENINVQKNASSSQPTPIVKLVKASDPSISQFVAKQPRILQAIIDVESAGDHKAVSRAGAQGLAQLMPAIQKHFGVTDPFDPVQNVEGAKKLLSEELERFNNTPLALAAYNAGSPRVKKAIKRAGTTRWPVVAQYLPKETRSYVMKVLNRFNGRN